MTNGRRPFLFGGACSVADYTMDWFDENPELLCVALEIIESWDGESSVNGVATTPPLPPNEEVDSENGEAGREGGHELTMSPAAKSTGGTNHGAKQPQAAVAIATQDAASAASHELKQSTISSTGVKRRDEIHYLRSKVADMEKQLATLHKHKAYGNSTGMPGASSVDAALEVTWQDIASRQQRLREKAELEQAKLRGLLETQMKVARGLIKLMQKARRVEEDKSFPVAKRAKLPIVVSDGVSEEEQFAHVDQLYLDMDEAFSYAKFHDGTLKFIDVEVDDEGDNDVEIEFRDAWSLPFEVDEVMSAIWEFIGKYSEQKGSRVDTVTVDAVSCDTFSICYSGSATVGALKGTFGGRGVFKRFPATSVRAAAITTNLLTLPHRGKGGELEGIRVQEDAFIRVVSAQSLTGQSDGRVLSVVQSNRRFRLTFDVDNAPASRRNAGVLTDFVLGHITQERHLKHETVETLLLHLRSQ